jgi:hypothetical protein
MSADDTWVVTRIHETIGLDTPCKYGVFHTMGEGEEPQWFSAANAVEVFNSPTAAILAGHRYNADSFAEYGCHVYGEVIADSEEEVGKHNTDSVSDG